MAYVLSIIANPAAAPIDEAACDRLKALFPGGVLRTLAQGIAYDITVEHADETIAMAARGALEGLPVDINILPADKRRKKLLIADMDSTIIEQECIDELAEFAGKRDEISAITERAMRGELDFESALKERVAMLKGLPTSVLETAFNKRISLTPGAKTLVVAMNSLGAETALISGGFTFFTSRVASAAGFQHHQANELLIDGDVLTGEVKEPILGRAAKQNALLRLAGAKKVPLEETLGVGDGANDLAMLDRAGLGVAFHAKPAVAEAADARIDHGDLTALLYLQGLSQAEFVAE